MKRIIDNFTFQTKLVFIDSSSSMEQFNLPVFIASIATPYGGLPIGYVICSDETTETCIKAFAHLKEFGINPCYFMTDDCQSMKTALRVIWPDAKQLLCTWHYEQAFWTWILDKKHGFTDGNRQRAIIDVQSLVLSTTEEMLNSRFDEIISKYANFPQFLKKINAEKSRAHEWCHAFRSMLFLLIFGQSFIIHQPGINLQAWTNFWAL